MSTPEEEAMHTYRPSGATHPHQWDVGYYDSKDLFNVITTVPSEDLAARHVNYLNGGTGAKFPA